jgi:hypothetical protein
MLHVHPAPKVFAEIIQKPEANHGLPTQHILHVLRDLRAMILSDFVAASSHILGHKADPAANQPSGVKWAQFAVRVRRIMGALFRILTELRFIDYILLYEDHAFAR